MQLFPKQQFYCFSFDLQLEDFGVDTEELKEPATKRIFGAWLEEWEKEIVKKNDCVAEARLLAKYKNLQFYLCRVANNNLKIFTPLWSRWFLRSVGLSLLCF